MTVFHPSRKSINITAFESRRIVVMAFITPILALNLTDSNVSFGCRYFDGFFFLDHIELVKKVQFGSVVVPATLLESSMSTKCLLKPRVPVRIEDTDPCAIPTSLAISSMVQHKRNVFLISCCGGSVAD
nr:hypothetical protein HmN_001018300 [Hymenolepis microstoma]